MYCICKMLLFKKVNKCYKKTTKCKKVIKSGSKVELKLKTENVRNSYTCNRVLGLINTQYRIIKKFVTWKNMVLHYPEKRTGYIENYLNKIQEN